jgi:hypothetical protein
MKMDGWNKDVFMVAITSRKVKASWSWSWRFINETFGIT